MRRTFFVKDRDNLSWMIETDGQVPTRDEELGEWDAEDLVSYDLIDEKTRSIYQYAYSFYAKNLKWEDEPLEFFGLAQFVKDLYTTAGFKYWVLKIEDMIEGILHSGSMYELECFFDFLDIYNNFRAEKGKSPSNYWLINRDEVPDIKTFEEFKERVTK